MVLLTDIFEEDSCYAKLKSYTQFTLLFQFNQEYPITADFRFNLLWLLVVIRGILKNHFLEIYAYGKKKKLISLLFLSCFICSLFLCLNMISTLPSSQTISNNEVPRISGTEEQQATIQQLYQQFNVTVESARAIVNSFMEEMRKGLNHKGASGNFFCLYLNEFKCSTCLYSTYDPQFCHRSSYRE